MSLTRPGRWWRIWLIFMIKKKSWQISISRDQSSFSSEPWNSCFEWSFWTDRQLNRGILSLNILYIGFVTMTSLLNKCFTAFWVIPFTALSTLVPIMSFVRKGINSVLSSLKKISHILVLLLLVWKPSQHTKLAHLGPAGRWLFFRASESLCQLVGRCCPVSGSAGVVSWLCYTNITFNQCIYLLLGWTQGLALGPQPTRCALLINLWVNVVRT